MMEWPVMAWYSFRIYVYIDQLKIYYGVHEKTNTHTGMLNTVFQIN